MKNLIKVFGIIALVAVMGFSMTACGGGGDDDNNNVNSQITYIPYLFSISFQSVRFYSHYFLEERRISAYVGTPAFLYKSI